MSTTPPIGIIDVPLFPMSVWIGKKNSMFAESGCLAYSPEEPTVTGDSQRVINCPPDARVDQSSVATLSVFFKPVLQELTG